MHKKLSFRNVSFQIALVGCIIVSFTEVHISKNNNGGNMLSFSELKFKDIGKETRTGNTTINKDELEIVAGGADIWGKHDEFRFGYKKIQGDFDVCIRILSLNASHLYTKAGIMARCDLSDSSTHVFYQVFPDNSPRNNNNGGCEFQYRSEKAAEMKAIYPDSKTAGHRFDISFPDTWIRLKRKGDVFESYLSKDSKNWALYSALSLKLPHDLFVGLAVTAHTSDAFTKARFAMARI